VLLAIFIVVFKAFKKASQNDNGNDLGAGSIDIHSYRTAQLANPGGNSLEVDIIDIRTHTVEELNSLEMGIDIRTYTMDELKNATDNFTTKVGQGASGFVYRAKLPGNRLGAVKRATNLDTDLFKQELSVLLRLPHHPQLVDLIGLCLQADERILVFEFVSSGSLYDRLHKNKGLTSPLSWATRIDIAFQVAVALQYLHEEAKPPILHRDVKSANVLLEDDNRAKLADFGLSKLGPKDNQFTNTAVRGSIGYMDPQYMKTHRFSAKSDVYSFGVLLLELMTGLKSLHEDTPLAEWTQTYRLSEDIDMFMTIVDRNMMGHINTMEVQNMIKVANLCLRDLSEERSSMREIVNMMQETRNLKANGNLSDGGEAPLLGNGKLSDGAQCLHH